MSIVPAVAFATVALTAASAAAQAPGLPRTYNATRIDSPTPVPGGAFGWGVYSAELTGDGKPDLLVAQGQHGTAAVPTQVFLFNGATGAHVDTILPPEENPLEPPAPPAGSPSGTTPGPATVYSSPELAFVYVETMPDLGSCPGGDGPDAGRICDASTIGPADGIPEIIVGARALRVNPTDGSTPATYNDPKVGRGYVIDGRTRAVLKRIDMPAADRAAFLARSSKRADGVPTSTAAFARTMASPQGMPPCAGPASENNDIGVGACPPPSEYPQAVRIGDLDGGGQPDIVIAARGFIETGDVIRNDGTVIAGSAAAGSHCRNTVRRQPAPTTEVPNPPVPAAATCGAGKIWTYRGEDIVGTSPEAILDDAWQSIQNPDAQSTGGEYGGNLFRIGDLSSCRPTATASNCSSRPDGIPDYIISFRGSDFPLKNPDLSWGLNMGSADLFDGATGLRARLIVSPDPQMRSTFSGGFNAGRAVGDLGATTIPDILLGSPFQNFRHADEGRLWVFNGDLAAGGGGEQSWNFAVLSDPEPYIGGNFGGSQTGVGDIVGGPSAPANEVLVGGFRFDNFTEASQNVVPDVNFMNATLERNLMTIPHPEGKTGDGFGVGLIPMGDLNADGFLDFAVSAYFADAPFGGQGRAWIFKSDNSPLPPPPTAPAPVAQGPTTPTTERESLQAGACTNRSVGTDADDTINGTIAGDEIFGFGGKDTIRGFAGRDCIDGQSGDDALFGGDDNDKVVGGSGRDRLDGDDGRDELYGGSGNDRVDGGTDRDMLAGGPGNDRLLGSAGNDRLFGEAGIDRIVGGGGRNIIDGGRGNDSIEARNGERDRIICGPGRDRVRADRFDRLNACESVSTGGKIRNRGALPPRTPRTPGSATASGTSKGTTR